MKTTAIILMLLFARTAFAAIFISEIMYDPQGADTGHEWVEIVNDGNASVDLAQSKFVEGGSNHGLVSLQGGTDLLSGAYAIIADNAQTFLSDHAGFSGIVLDSSFSLNNTVGETIAFKIPDGTIDTVVYTSDMGGSGDGNSLQKINGSWHGAPPTLGTVNTGVVSAPSQESSTNTAQTNTNSIAASFPVEPQIIADAGAATRIVSTGAPLTFTGRVFGIKKEPIENARMVWSFGDGGRAEGASVVHTYYYPGDYIAVLDAASGYYSASDRVAVHVVAPLLTLRTGGDLARSFVAIENRGSDEVDLSIWQIKSNDKIFILPQNTILGARKTLTLASEVTGLSTPAGSIVSLHFPNGTRVEMQSDVPALAPVQFPTKDPVSTKQVSIVDSSHNSAPQFLAQEASVTNAFADTATSSPTQESGNLWPWYAGVAFMGAIALIGLRFTREKVVEPSAEATADDFEIVEDDGDKDDVF